MKNSFKHIPVFPKLAAISRQNGFAMYPIKEHKSVILYSILTKHLPMPEIVPSITPIEGTIYLIDDTIRSIDGTIESIVYTIFSIDGTIRSIESTIDSIEGTIRSIVYTIFSIEGTIFEIEDTIKSLQYNFNTENQIIINKKITNS